MTEAWKSKFPSGLKLVLLALCDCADDNGTCWPSIENISKKCSMGQRTVFRHISDLSSFGAIRIEHREGRASIYWLNPCQFGTPANLAPTPANLAPINIKEPSKNRHSRNLEEDTRASDKKKPARNKRKASNIALSTNGIWENISPEQVQLWGRAYPALGLDAELAAAAAWILANPSNRKSNYERFITNWLKRAQDRAPRVGQGNAIRVTSGFGSINKSDAIRQHNIAVCSEWLNESTVIEHG